VKIIFFRPISLFIALILISANKVWACDPSGNATEINACAYSPVVPTAAAMAINYIFLFLVLACLLRIIIAIYQWFCRRETKKLIGRVIWTFLFLSLLMIVKWFLALAIAMRWISL
jgi:hypothetical protein